MGWCDPEGDSTTTFGSWDTSTWTTIFCPVKQCHSPCPCQSCSPKKACAAAVVFRSVRHHPLLTCCGGHAGPRGRDEIDGHGGQVLLCLRARYPSLAAKSAPGYGLCAWAIHGTHLLRSPPAQSCCQGQSPGCHWPGRL